MARKPRYFAIVSHCLLNPRTRVHILGKNFDISRKITNFFLYKSIGIIQLPCPEFTAMGYLRNPQGRQQYDNTFFIKHCKKELENYVDMVSELIKNRNTPLCYIGIQGSPTCSINWGRHKTNRYNTESMIEDNISTNASKFRGCKSKNLCNNTSNFGVMTAVLDEMLKEREIIIPYLEAPIREPKDSDKVRQFFVDIYGVLEKQYQSRKSSNRNKLK